MVEFALTVTLLLMILFGIITLGVTHNDNLSLENAARESSRFAATYPVEDAGSDLAWLRDVAQVAQDAATGSLDPGADGRVICVARGAGTDPSGFVRIRVTGPTIPSAGSSEANWCFPNAVPSEDQVVQVALERNGWIQVILFEATPRLAGQATNRFERAS